MDQRMEREIGRFLYAVGYAVVAASTARLLMSPLQHLLETFYERVAPRGIAFIGSHRFGVSFGRAPTDYTYLCESTAGASQYHLEASDVSVYVSAFGWGKFLIAQFDFQEEYPPPAREWLAFAQLATAVAAAIESVDAQDDPGTAEVAVPRPRPGPLRTRAAEAPLEG